MGAQVAYHDPHVDTLKLDGVQHESVPLTAEALEASDAVVITTDHSEIDYNLVLAHAGIVLDPRNALADLTGSALVYPIAGPPRSWS